MVWTGTGKEFDTLYSIRHLDMSINFYTVENQLLHESFVTICLFTVVSRFTLVICRGHYTIRTGNYGLSLISTILYVYVCVEIKTVYYVKYNSVDSMGIGTVNALCKKNLAFNKEEESRI